MFELIQREKSSGGIVCEISQGQTTLGRDSVNDIQVMDQSVSRNHCILTCVKDRLMVLDLGSTNGTRINNGNRVKQGALQDGDELRCGNVRFKVRSKIAGASPGPAVRGAGEAGAVPMHTMVVEKSDMLSQNAVFTDASYDTVFGQSRPKDLFALAEQAGAGGGVPVGGEDRVKLRHVMTYLHVFKQISDSIGMAAEPGVLFQKAMEVIFDVLPAENGVVLLIDPESGMRENAAAMCSDGGDAHIEISQGVMNHAMNTQQGVLVSDAQDDAQLSENRSVQVLNLRSVMCAPLLVRNQAVGLIYVDNRTNPGCFSTDDLSLLVSITHLLAVFLDSSLLFRKLNAKIDLANKDLQEQSELLRIYNERIRTVMNAIDDAVLVVDTEGMIAMSNNAAIDLLGMHMGESFDDALESEDLVAYLRDLIDGETREPFEITLTRNGEDKHVRATTAKTFLQDGTVSGLVTTLADVSRYREVDDLKNEFIGNVSHELRAPLTSILGFTTMIKQAPDLSAAERDEYLGIIQSEAERLNDLVNDLLDVSRIEQNRIEMEITKEQPALILEHVLRSCHIKAKDKGLELQTDLAEAPPIMMTDCDYLKQVLTNVIDNAVKYTPDGGCVSVRCAQNGENVEFVVQDTGIGISKDDQGHLFEKFYRVPGDYAQQVTGTGLGLYITKTLVQMLGGDIGVDSEPGQGTCFTITMPLSPSLDE